MSRYHSPFSKSRIKPTGSPPSPGLGSTPQKKFEADTPYGWPKAPGQKGPKWNPGRLGFTEVKCSVVQDLGDDKWIQKAIKHPGALHRQLKVPEGEKIPEAKLEAAAEKGGKTGKRARLAMTLRKLNK